MNVKICLSVGLCAAAGLLACGESVGQPASSDASSGSMGGGSASGSTGIGSTSTASTGSASTGTGGAGSCAGKCDPTAQYCQENTLDSTTCGHCAPLPAACAGTPTCACIEKTLTQQELLNVTGCTDTGGVAVLSQFSADCS